MKFTEFLRCSSQGKQWRSLTGVTPCYLTLTSLITIAGVTLVGDDHQKFWKFHFNIFISLTAYSKLVLLHSSAMQDRRWLLLPNLKLAFIIRLWQTTKLLSESRSKLSKCVGKGLGAEFRSGCSSGINTEENCRCSLLQSVNAGMLRYFSCLTYAPTVFCS